MSNRVNDAKTSVRIVIMQRLHEEDLVGYILEKNNSSATAARGNSSSSRWSSSRPPRRTPEHPPCPRSSAGQTRAPSRASCSCRTGSRPPSSRREDVEKGSAGYAGQYQQAPAPKEGNKFLRPVVAILALRRRAPRAAQPARGRERRRRPSCFRTSPNGTTASNRGTSLSRGRSRTTGSSA
jgi:hypothetical protein